MELDRRKSDWIGRFRKLIGINKAIAWTVVSQGSRFITGTLSLILLIRYLSSESQGYALTFSSVLGISIFLEMGFSQNILQFTSHEFARLQFLADRSLGGDGRALSRLSSLARLSLKYYGIGAAVFLVIAIVGGNWFFSVGGDTQTNWKVPWAIACGSSSVGLFLNPCWAFLQGCNQIAEIEKFRFLSSLGAFVVSAVGLMSGGGLYAVTFPGVFLGAASVIYLGVKWRRFFCCLIAHGGNDKISWKNEIWPFQWRIAVSWICGYFIFTVLTPIVFSISGAVAAGRIGVTVQMLRMIFSLSGSWLSAQLPVFGMLVARREWENLDTLWKKSTIRNFAVYLVTSCSAGLALAIIGHYFSSFATRYASGVVFVLFAASYACQCLITSYAYYLRAFKKEVFVIVSVLQAVLCSSLVAIFTMFAGELGAAIGYFIATLIAFGASIWVFRRKRTEFKVEAEKGCYV